MGEVVNETAVVDKRFKENQSTSTPLRMHSIEAFGEDEKSGKI